MTAPTPSSPDPDRSRRARPYNGHGGRYGEGQQGPNRRGDPAGGDQPASPYGAPGPSGPAGGDSGAYGNAAPYGNGDVYGNDGAYGQGAYGHDGSYGYSDGTPAHEPYGPDHLDHPDRPEHPHHPEHLDEERPDVRGEVRAGVLCALPVLVLGVGLGLLWWWLAPRVPLVSVDGGVFLKDPEGEEAIGADGTFVLLAVAFGLVTGLVAFLRSRGGGVGVVVGLAVGALLGSVLAWRLGVWLGPSSDLTAAAKAAGENKTFDGPLKLQAKGALLVWPFFALVTHLALMGAFGRREPEPAAPLPPEDGKAAPHW